MSDKPAAHGALSLLRIAVENENEGILTSAFAAAERQLAELPLDDILNAYVQVRGEGPTDVPAGIVGAIIARIDPDEVIACLANMVAVDPAMATTVALEVARIHMRSTVNPSHALLGRLNRGVHDALLGSLGYTRDRYLTVRLAHRDMPDTERSLAAALISEWAGTFDDLLATVKTLAARDVQ
jgi:hypothetical protein